jgi:hypothetical protein
LKLPDPLDTSSNAAPKRSLPLGFMRRTTRVIFFRVEWTNHWLFGRTLREKMCLQAQAWMAQGGLGTRVRVPMSRIDLAICKKTAIFVANSEDLARSADKRSGTCR